MNPMMVEVETLNKEIIKPSSPTPDHLRQYQFSFLDQQSPPVYTSLVLFYKFNDQTQPSITEISKHLKKSLAQALTLYYPLAGRQALNDKDNNFIDCNDEGVPFVEAQVKCQLSDVLNNPNPSELNKLVPFELYDTDNNFVFGAQLNVFECGGFAISLCLSHKIADALSMLMFTKTWAAFARGEDIDDDEAKIERPQFVSATLFPPKDHTGFDARRITQNKVTKRFVFDACMIEDVRAQYGLMTMKRPSRVETLSAFLFSRFVASNNHHQEKLYMLAHVVNLRPRFDPPLPQRSFGNLHHVAITTPSSNTGEDQCYGLTWQVREAIKKIDKDYIKALQQGPDEHLSFNKKNSNSFNRGEIVTSLGYTSLCKFPLYEDNDFGWGRPAWVGLPLLPFNNLVTFVDAKEGGGIEAYVSLAEESMAKLQSDTQFLHRVRLGWTGSSSRLTHQPIRFNWVANSYAQNRPNIIKKQIHTKPVKLGSGPGLGPILFRSLLKFSKRK